MMPLVQGGIRHRPSLRLNELNARLMAIRNHTRYGLTMQPIIRQRWFHNLPPRLRIHLTRGVPN